VIFATPSATWLSRRLLWAGLVTALVTAALMIWVDIPLTMFFHQYPETWWWKFFKYITDFASGAFWYPLAVLGIVVAYVRHKRRAPNPIAFTTALRAWLFMIVTMASSGTFVNAMKLMVGRERPRLLFRDGTTGFHPFNLNLADCSFPSGHTQSIWTAMLALSFIYPPLRALFIAVAFLVSASRIVISAHYAGDVAASIYIAFVATLLWRQWFESNGMSVSLYRPRVAQAAAI